MIRATLAAAAVLLASCTSYSELKTSEPTVELVTAKTPQAYTACLAPKLMEIWPGQVSVIPDGDNTVVAVASSGQSMTATVTVEPSGRVTLREIAHLNLGNVFQRARDATRSCS